MKKLIFVLILTLFFCFCASGMAGFGFCRGPRGQGNPPAPMLMAPYGDVVLKKGSSVEFRWSSETDRAGINHYDFRLYRGPRMVEETRICKQEVPQNQTSIVLAPDLFEDGQTYAWSIRQIGFSKSRANHLIFKVKKEGV